MYLIMYILVSKYKHKYTLLVCYMYMSSLQISMYRAMSYLSIDRRRPGGASAAPRRAARMHLSLSLYIYIYIYTHVYTYV